MTTVLVVLGDRSLSSIIFSYFWISFHNSTALGVIEYFPYLIKKFHEVTLCRSWGFIVMLSEGKLDHVLKINCDKLFKNLLTNKIVSRRVSS